MTSFRSTAACLLLALGALCGCFGDRRDPKSPGLSIWLGGDSTAPDLAGLERLAAQGVTEYFVEAARVTWSGSSSRLESLAVPRMARREKVTLVIVGEAPSDTVDVAAAAATLAAGIDGLRVEAERAGQLPVGVHFDLATGRSLGAYATLLDGVREKLEERLYLSASLDRAALASPEAIALTAPLDFLVAFLYGQRPGELEDPTAWDLQEVERHLPALAALDRKWLLGVTTIGSATLRDRGGRPRGSTSELDLGTLVRNGALELKRGFSLEGVDRQVYEFRAKSATRLASWDLGPGESVRVVRAATSNIEELLRRSGAWASEDFLGQLFWRLPATNERLSLTAANLAEAAAADPARPALDLVVERLAADRKTWQLRATLTSGNDEGTDLAFIDANFIELEVTGGHFAEVETGDFSRFDLYFQGDRATMRALREPDKVRLSAPFVEGRQRLSSGPILLRLTEREAVVTSGGTFMLTDGEMVELEQREWAFGPGR